MIIKEGLMFPFEYEVVCCNDPENEIIHGITFATNFADAVAKIESYYGKDLISLNVYGNEYSSVYELDPVVNYHKPWFKISKVEKNF